MAFALAVAVVLAAGGCGSAVRSTTASPPDSVVAAGADTLQVVPAKAAAARSPQVAAPRPAEIVERLARRVEAIFEAGQREYQAGHLSGARQQFDLALDILLSSGLDVRREPRLAELFDRIVDTAHRNEIAAFRAGDGFSEQQTMPAPLDEILALDISGDELVDLPVAPVDPELRTTAEGELQEISHDLPLTVNDTVLSLLRFFQTPRGREIVEAGLRRAGRYRPMIEHILYEEGLPSDLIFMAQAESAFRPQAGSRAGARGIWQFMPARGREYGLERSWWTDERQDPEMATRAAARHLRDLYEMFGDWYLVMTAYNAGPAAVQRAIEGTGYADFWELSRRNALPRETRSYVPIVLALTLIGKDPARYGFYVEPEEPFRTDIVRPGHPIDLRLVAETIDVEVDLLREMNPTLLRLVTPSEPDFALHLPEGTAERFYAEIAVIPPEKWVSWRRYRVVEGDTLSAIAGKYRLTANSVAQANGIDLDATLRIGTKLIIPVTTPPQPARGELMRYTIRRGDTLSGIARRFQVTVAEIKEWNNLRSDRIIRGARLNIYPGGMPEPSNNTAKAETDETTLQASAAPGGSVVYQVRPGETLWSIARAFRTTVEAIRSGNSFLFSRPLQAGDRLLISPAAN